MRPKKRSNGIVCKIEVRTFSESTIKNFQINIAKSQSKSKLSALSKRIQRRLKYEM